MRLRIAAGWELLWPGQRWAVAQGSGLHFPCLCPAMMAFLSCRDLRQGLKKAAAR
jgi:hypothetical protein